MGNKKKIKNKKSYN